VTQSTVPELPAEGDGVNPMRLWMAVRKRLPLVGAIAAVVTLAMAFFTLGQPKIYQTKTTVLIDPNPPRPLGKELNSGLEVGSGGYWTNREYYETQLQLILSRRLATATVRALGLNRDPAFLTNRPRSDDNPETEVDSDVAASVLLSRMSIEPVKNTRLVEVVIEDADPERARRILSTHIDTYIQKNVDDAVTDTGNAADWMRDQLEKLRAELDKNEFALHEYRRDNGILSINLDDQLNMFRDEMVQIDAQMTRARVDRERIASRVGEIDKIDPKDPENLPVAELLNNSLIAGLRDRYASLKGEHDAALAQGKGENHPDVRAISAKIEETRVALMLEVRNVQKSLSTDMSAIGKEAAGLARLARETKSEALDLNLLEIEYRRLERSKKNTERLFDLVLERSKDIDLTSQMRFNNIRVIDPAARPKSPIRPNVPANMAGGFIAGLVLGVVAALSREQMDRTIKAPEDLAQLGLTYLGMLPRMNFETQAEGKPGRRERRRRRTAQPASAPGGPPELMVHADPRGGVAEAARAIRTNILFMSPDAPYRRLLVGSAVPSEGKTTVACSIAIAMAQAGQRVALIDCDLRRPRLHRIFGSKNETGVTSVLLEPDTLDSAILDSPVPNLRVLTSGPIPPNPAELLHSDTFGRLLQELDKRFDRIVLDSPPLVPVTDAAVISTRVDATVLVVKPFMTRKEVARHAVRSLRDVGGKILGAVLNDLDLTRRDATYYYQYHSKYYYTYGEGPAPSTNESPPAS
jgi:polysaccharide biosynthesis transport protein